MVKWEYLKRKKLKINKKMFGLYYINWLTNLVNKVGLLRQKIHFTETQVSKNLKTFLFFQDKTLLSKMNHSNQTYKLYQVRDC